MTKIEPVYLNDLELEMFRVAISTYDGAVCSTSEQTYIQLEKDCKRMNEIIDLMEEGHSIRYRGAWKSDQATI